MVGKISILLNFYDGPFHEIYGVKALGYSKENYEFDLARNYLKDLEVQK